MRKPDQTGVLHGDWRGSVANRPAGSRLPLRSGMGIYMNIFDIIGPVMVGPSSSHTAGAVRIGRISGKLLGEEVKEAEIYLHGSFLATGKGHGTDRALVAGLLGMEVDDERIPHSFEIAEERGLRFTIEGISLPEAHPNSVKLILTGASGRKVETIAASIGGGRISIREIDGLTADFSAEYPTLVVRNLDEPGHVVKVASLLGERHINIATMKVFRNERGGRAVMVIEVDQEVDAASVKWMEEQDGIEKVIYLSLEE